MDQYKKSFQISANTHNIKQHDAILLTSNDVSAGVGASFSAEIVTYSDGAASGANGKPLRQTANYEAPTGDTIILRGTKGGEEGFQPQQIFPMQIKSVHGITAANVYGLRYS